MIAILFQEMQRTDTYYKKEQFQGFISEGQLLTFLLPLVNLSPKLTMSINY